MKKNSLILLLIVFYGASSLFAQDGVFKFKTVEISFAAISQPDNLISIELYQSGSYQNNKNGKMGFRQNHSYNDTTETYTLRYSYTGIGGGSDNRLACPELFVKLTFNNNIKEYNVTIPIVMSVCGTSQTHEIKLLNIDLNPLLQKSKKMILVDKKDGYQIVDLETIQTNKLVKIRKN
jgi:hypothetical protein